MNSCELVTFVTTIACAISKSIPKEDLPLITAIFGQLSSSLAMITVQEETCERKEKLAEEKDKKDNNQANQDQQQGTDQNAAPEEAPLLNENADLSLITIPPPDVIIQGLNMGM